VSVPRQESTQSYICELGISILPLSTILILHFGFVPSVVFFVFHFIVYILYFILEDIKYQFGNIGNKDITI